MYAAAAKRRDYEWALSREAFHSLVESSCHYCGARPERTLRGARGSYTYNGLDRMNNALGYTESNVVPCCGKCNHAKKDLPYATFVAWLQRVTEHRALLTDTVT